MLPGNSVARSPWTGVLLLALTQCAGATENEPTGTSRDSILAGEASTALDSPVLYLDGPQGACTAMLVAPNLAVTARHCVAQSYDGPFTCTPQGDLVLNGSAAGQIGTDDAPSSLAFYTNARVVAGTALSGSPDAVGAQTISTNTPTACRDDLAFVVLEQPISGVAVAPVRIDRPTAVGETVAVWGYGLTEHSNDPLALRARLDAQIVGVGPDMPASTTQAAPLRAVRIGPDDITCSGDSGGPVVSAATGAFIAVASLGNEPNMTMPTCTNYGSADTTGPRLAAYYDLAMSAFSAAGASPIVEPGAADAAAAPGAGAEGGDDGSQEDGEASSLLETGPIPPRDAEGVRPPTAVDGSCAMTYTVGSRSTPTGRCAIVLGVLALAIRRRGRLIGIRRQ